MKVYTHATGTKATFWRRSETGTVLLMWNRLHAIIFPVVYVEDGELDACEHKVHVKMLSQ